ncbi:MAG TPA: hypothetical protein VFO83_11685 [Aggregicoccus sp.]|nr:hypothetical protein [Aggregicoccus sp.]
MEDWKPQPARAGDIRQLALSPEEGFLLSRLDGSTAVRHLPALTGLSVPQVQALLSRLVAAGAVQPAAAEGAGPPRLTPAPSAPPRLTPAPEAALLAAVRPTPASAPAASAEGLPPAALPVTADPLDALPELLPEAPPEQAVAAEARGEGEGEEPAEDAAQEEVPDASGDLRRLFETQLHPLPADERVARARTAVDAELSALCFDPLPAVVRAVLDNPRTGLTQARLIARHHHSAVGLDALGGRPAFAADVGVRRWLARNPQLPAGLFRRLWGTRRLLEQHKLTVDRDIPEGTRRTARELLRTRFASGPAEERVELILRTEGRALASLSGLPVDGKTAALLCGRTYTSTLLLQNLARWSAAPPQLIAHLLRQEAVRRQPQLRAQLQRHPNAPAEARRGS